jgi:hypothetical protein
VTGASGAIQASTSPTVNYITATSTTASSTLYNLVVSNNASTTNLIISGTQTGGSMSYTASSTNYSCSSGTCTYTNSIPTTANFGIGTYEIAGGITIPGEFTIARLGITSSSAYLYVSPNLATYSFTWSGSNFVVVETADAAGSWSVSGTIYWYR